MTPQQLAAMIDHTALKPETTTAQIEQLCREAAQNNFASVCVNSVYVPMAARLLEGSAVKVCTVVGFPLGATTTSTKIFEAREAIRLGATEVDMVLWVGGVKAGRWDWVQEDIAEVAHACRERDALLKVIFECFLLTDDEKKRACEICVKAGAHFVKTSTGFSAGGATVEDVRLMSDIVKEAGLGVKAAGGIRTYEDAMRMIEAGATRIGASASVKIIEEAKTAART
ncbi:deoxyribose-phosphate aldolase [candidate division KSB1 bacterium]|nr:MAG: deoxyribose-phosphate aldolase [candidate division KSB1 bacterium]